MTLSSHAPEKQVQDPFQTAQKQFLNAAKAVNTLRFQGNPIPQELNTIFSKCTTAYNKELGNKYKGRFLITLLKEGFNPEIVYPADQKAAAVEKLNQRIEELTKMADNTKNKTVINSCRSTINILKDYCLLLQNDVVLE